jgi:hypothetical protein
MVNLRLSQWFYSFEASTTSSFVSRFSKVIHFY